MSKSGSKIREQVAHFLVDIHNFLLVLCVRYVFQASFCNSFGFLISAFF